MNVVLMGMPASGKSTVGRELARLASMNFVDVDHKIEERAGKPLQKIIDDEGLSEFARLEEDTLNDLILTNTVVAPGGSGIYYPDALKKIAGDKGYVIYLRYGLDTILGRLNTLSDRGVTLKPGQTLEDLYYERCPLYEAGCDIIIDGDNKSLLEITREILKIIGR